MNRAWLALIAIVSFASAANATTAPREIVTKGGIRAWLVEEHALPLVSVRVAFRDSGSAYDPAGKEGRASLVASLLTEGAGSLDSRAFTEALEERAIRFDISNDEDALRAGINTIADRKREAFSYLSMALASPRFDNDAIERVRAQTLAYLKSEEKEPSYLLERGWAEMAFGNHPYAKPGLGTEASVKSLTRADLKAYAAHYLTRENLIVSVVGDITEKELVELLDASFLPLPERYTPDTTVKQTALPTEGKQRVIETDIPQTLVTFGLPGLMRDDPDYYAGYVMNEILGGGGSLTSRLALEIREKAGLAYSVGSVLEPRPYAGLWHGDFSTRNGEVGNALAKLKATLADFADRGVTGKELTDAQNYLIGSFMLNLDSNGDIANYLINMQIYRLDIGYLARRNSLIAAVTKPQVDKVAKRLLNPDRLLTVMVGKPELSTKQDKP